VFYSLDTELAKSLGKDEKEKFDTLRLGMDQLDSLSQNVHKLFLMGRQIEELLIHQRSYFDVHFERNRYKEEREKMAADMLAESTPKPRRIEIARNILQMVDMYSLCSNLYLMTRIRYTNCYQGSVPSINRHPLLLQIAMKGFQK